MKIDTTAAILQLSSVLAASAGVAAPSQAAGADSGTPATVATASAAPNQKPLSFQQMLAQIQQAAAEASQSSTPAAADEPVATPAKPAKDADSDPTSISTALMALLSQSNQPVPVNVPATPANPVAPTIEAKPTDTVGTVAAQTGGAVPTVAVGCPEAIVAGSVPKSPAAQPPDGKMQPIAIKNPTPPPTGDMPITPPATPAVVTADSKGSVDPSGPPVVPVGPQADQPPVTAEPVQANKASETVATPVSTTIDSNPVVDVKAADSKAADVRVQAADVSTPIQATKESAPEVTPDKISGTVARHTRNEAVQTAISSAAKEGHVDFSNLTNLISDAVVAASSDAVEPVKEISDNAKSKETSETTALDQGMPGETANGITDAVTAVDPASQGAAVDAHSLAHHLESMVMQRLDQPESTDKSSVVLRLDPPELGRVNVHMSVTNDVVSIRMVTTDDAARQVIERQLSQLQQSLTDKGIAFQDFQVQTGGGSQQQQSSHQGFAKHWADNSGYSAFGGRRASTTVSTPQIRSGILAQLDYVA
jgi:flagellar hook-length control protein FliK